MSCTHPVTVWWSAKINDNCNHVIVFDKSKSDGRPSFKIPCGQCTGCRIARGSDWTTRLVHESKFHLISSFVTLTYDDPHLPADRTLVKRDMQLFMKRVRKHYANLYPGIKIRFFGAGEYGEQTLRPHYHLIIFGVAFLEDRRPHSKNRYGDQLYISETLTRLWGKGFCDIGGVSPRSCGYVAQYAFKKVNGKQSLDHYFVRVDEATGEVIYRQKEFALMSTHPGIGYQHYSNYRLGMYKRGSVIDRGRELPIPKFYDRKLKQDDPVLMKRIKDERADEALKNKAEQTPERLAVKDEILLAKRKEYLKRSL